jgi:hypothetical protein
LELDHSEAMARVSAARAVPQVEEEAGEGAEHDAVIASSRKTPRRALVTSAEPVGVAVADLQARPGAAVRTASGDAHAPRRPIREAAHRVRLEKRRNQTS